LKDPILDQFLSKAKEMEEAAGIPEISKETRPAKKT
jgi:hypothetical protein